MAESHFALPSGAFRFELGLRRGSEEFFRNEASDAPALAERQRWLVADPGRYALADPGSEPLLSDVAKFAQGINPEIVAHGSELAMLGQAWAPDFLVLAPDAAGALVLRAGCVCFPSHWDLGEKIGQPIAGIHGPVPTLNETLARQIDGFLAALRSGLVWERWNWGLAATPERNNHPARELPRLAADAKIEGVWLRAEHQSFCRLPGSGAVLFGIRLIIEPLAEVVRAPGAVGRLAELLATMPEAVAAYKGVAAARAALIDALRRGAN